MWKNEVKRGLLQNNSPCKLFCLVVQNIYTYTQMDRMSNEWTMKQWMDRWAIQCMHRGLLTSVCMSSVCMKCWDGANANSVTQNRHERWCQNEKQIRRTWMKTNGMRVQVWIKCMQINDNEWIMLNGIWFDQQLNIVKYISEKNNEQTIEL